MKEVQAIDIKLHYVMNQSFGAKWHSLNLTGCTGASAGRILEFFFLGVLRH